MFECRRILFVTAAWRESCRCEIPPWSPAWWWSQDTRRDRWCWTESSSSLSQLWCWDDPASDHQHCWLHHSHQQCLYWPGSPAPPSPSSPWHLSVVSWLLSWSHWLLICNEILLSTFHSKINATAVVRPIPPISLCSSIVITTQHSDQSRLSETLIGAIGDPTRLSESQAERSEWRDDKESLRIYYYSFNVRET